MKVTREEKEEILEEICEFSHNYIYLREKKYDYVQVQNYCDEKMFSC